MLGRVQINNLNLIQGPLPSVENYFLFIGRGAGKNEGALVTMNQQTDLAAVLGSEDSNLKKQVAAARLNAGQNWNACVIPLAAEATWAEAVDFAMERVSVEAVVVTDPVTSASELEAMQAKAESIMAKYMRPLFFIPCSRGPLPTETWGTFTAALAAITQVLACDQVNPVATVWGAELGSYAGRLANSAVTVADSPMRVATGALVGSWAERPKDKDGRILDMSVLDALDKARWSVPQWYPDYPGVYWGDGNVLDVPGGDFQTIENLRVVQKAMRSVYPLAVARIADRALNSTPASMEAAKMYFARPLREMSRSRKVLGQVFPGEIEPPADDAIGITWPTKYSVVIDMTVRPYNCPKSITCNILLDLTNYG
ncbi:DUF2586 domain-containing protein [Nitratidesulfovibrio vulgaris]|uniref:DUF2586 domain-containing protein n=1 Tax=Nitratidesulfovibrio vulgaris TaxID=881 RepID=UPI0023000704|nr:DUF2586 domain-containing protein [Nitratidesulfovibrio vulgaris]WCB45206.1 DUF2586 domain-containing protein [Nitratidesulfovibrio vulgaris]